MDLLTVREKLITNEFQLRDYIHGTLAHCQSENPKLNAFISITERLAEQSVHRLEQLSIAERRRLPLFGIPIGIKDNILTKGHTTTAASRMLANFVPPYNATVVNRLESQGAVIVGKNNLDEFAMGSSNENSFFGAVRNPHNLEFVPGGSSGGSAAAVAARLVRVSLGSDTGGSVRQPAAFCGAVGLKPTYGRVSRFGLIAFASSLDQIGVIAASVKECAVVYNCIAGHDPLDSTSHQRAEELIDLTDLDRPIFSASQLGSNSSSHPLKGLRIGLVSEYSSQEIDLELRAAIDSAVKSLAKLGAEIVTVALPSSDLAVATYYILASAEAASNLARFDGIRFGHADLSARGLEEYYIASRSQGFGAETKRRIVIGNYVLSSGYYDAYYRQAQKVRHLIGADFRSAFAECDLILAPTTPTPAFKIGSKTSDPLLMYLQDLFTIPPNLAGLPALNVPCGFNAEGLPLGIQLIGQPWSEELLLRTAYHFEA